MSADVRSNGGLYGKIPSIGDFVHRRLPASFVEPWNQWLERSIAASRAELGERWHDAYLTSPLWRFALDPGVAGADGWLGVLASSVDEVRRCYPMTVALSLPAGMRLGGLVNDLGFLFEALEKLVLQLIDGTCTPDAATVSLDQLARALPQIAAPDAVWSRGLGERLRLDAHYPSIAAMATHLGSSVDDRGESGLPRSAWWHAGWDAAPPASLVCAGLPSPEIFVCFLDSAWQDRGWSPAIDL
jgi:type VI secretion system protein ImpM